MGVLTAVLCLLRCVTVLLDIMSLQNVGEQLKQQHTKSSQKTGIFTLNICEDYLLSINWLTFGRLFTWTQVWHTIPTAMAVLDQLTLSLLHSPMLTDADMSWSVSCQLLYCQQPDMSASQLPVAVLSSAWHVSQPAASCCAASSLENYHHYLTLIQDSYQCNNTSCSVFFFPWWQWLWGQW
jgi:hypothetical protein